MPIVMLSCGNMKDDKMQVKILKTGPTFMSEAQMNNIYDNGGRLVSFSQGNGGWIYVFEYEEDL